MDSTLRDLAGDDQVVPFQVPLLDVRGRVIKAGPMLDTILDRHDYPEPVSALLAEIIVLTVLLGSSLKFDGKFSVQTKTDGPVSLLVVDFATPDAVRAYARFDAELVETQMLAGLTGATDMLGKGVLAMTIDQGKYMSRYQGIVPLEGESLEDVAHQYFRQSEQIPTLVRLAVASLWRADRSGKPRRHWRAGGLMVQFLPESEERMRQADLSGGDVPRDMEFETPLEDASWAEARILAQTAEDHELTDPQIACELLLYRLYHQQGIAVHEPVTVAERCGCSSERVRHVLTAMSADEREEMADDGQVSVQCEFCSTKYLIPHDDILI